MSLKSFLKRSVRKVGKVVKKAAPLAAVAGLGFALGPAGVGVGSRILGGLGRAASGASKVAKKVQPLLSGLGAPIGGQPFPSPTGATPPILPRQPAVLGRVMDSPGRAIVKEIGRALSQPIAPSTLALPETYSTTPVTARATVTPSPVRTPPVPRAPVKPVNVDTGPRFADAIPPELARYGGRVRYSPGAMPNTTYAGVANMSLVPLIGKLAQRIPQILRNPAVGGTIGGAAGGLLTGGAGQLAGLITGEKKKGRRMNYGNAKAARRAIRRIKGVRKLLQGIERQLPRKATRSRRDLGPGHTHVR